MGPSLPLLATFTPSLRKKTHANPRRGGVMKNF
nr:MAG TPA: hypothetical protein [Caudoviricetes sp.]DAX88577.1 MAG TPA: hypothetical protein [Caudoviricetes sp.]